MTCGRRPPDGREHRAREVVGEYFRAARHRAGWSQLEAARRSGAGKSTIQLIECGMFFPTWPTSVKLCNAYGLRLVDLADLIDREFGARRESAA